MPHIYIREEDNTTASAEDDYNVVYVPIVCASGREAKDLPESPITSVDELYSYVTTKVDDKGETTTYKYLVDDKSANTEDDNIGYVYAKSLIERGLPVLPEIVLNAGSIDWDKLTDKGLYSIKFLTAGGLELETESMLEMLDAAAKRGDCIALLDHEKDIAPVGDQTYAAAVREELGLDVGATDGALVSSSNLKFGAAYSPWCKFDGFDSPMPPSFAALAAYANSVESNPNWYAAAGKSRGTIPGIKAVLHQYGDAECNSLQARVIKADGDFDDVNDNTGIAINPITYIRAFGDYVVWGNRTLIKNDGVLTASSFLNIRNLCCDIKKELYAAAREFTFEQNGDILWVNFSARIRPLLDKALSGGGIKGYKLIKEETNKRGRLKARVKIVPIEAVEDFDLTLEMTDSIETVDESI